MLGFPQKKKILECIKLNSVSTTNSERGNLRSKSGCAAVLSLSYTLIFPRSEFVILTNMRMYNKFRTRKSSYEIRVELQSYRYLAWTNLFFELGVLFLPTQFISASCFELSSITSICMNASTQLSEPHPAAKHTTPPLFLTNSH